jgi:DNA-binding LytR/AlgR family response regulator
MPYGYLLKPVQQQNVFAAIETALVRFSSEGKNKKNNDKASLEVENSKEAKDSLIIKDVLFIKDEYQYIKILLSEIDFIKSDGNYIAIYSSGKKRVLKETLKNIESKLINNMFFQVHRSFIVNVLKIDSIRSTKLVVGEHEIPIVKSKKDSLLELLNTL